MIQPPLTIERQVGNRYVSLMRSGMAESQPDKSRQRAGMRKFWRNLTEFFAPGAEGQAFLVVSWDQVLAKVGAARTVSTVNRLGKAQESVVRRADISQLA